MRHEKTPLLRKYITLPLLLSPDRDEELVKITEHRVATFSHDLIPDYLRTRPDPELENRHLSLEARANATTSDQQQKQLTVMDKITKDTLKLITREREEMDAKSAGRSELEKTHSVEDTGALLAAINHGKGLKAAQPSIPTRQSPACSSSNSSRIKRQLRSRPTSRQPTRCTPTRDSIRDKGGGGGRDIFCTFLLLPFPRSNTILYIVPYIIFGKVEPQ